MGILQGKPESVREICGTPPCLLVPTRARRLQRPSSPVHLDQTKSISYDLARVLGLEVCSACSHSQCEGRGFDPLPLQQIFPQGALFRYLSNHSTVRRAASILFSRLAKPWPSFA